MREQLIRYLLGELDDEERRELRRLLQENPELRQELAHLRECFAANQDVGGEPLPPRQLAERTAERVTNSDDEELELVSQRAMAMRAAGEPPAGVLGWSLADLAVAFGVMLAMSMLVFPALRDSRNGTRRTVCQHNQAELGFLVFQHAQDHGDYLPQVGPNEKGGIYVVRLVEEGYIQPDELAKLLICPASPVANEIRAGRLKIQIPDAETLRRMSPAQLTEFAATASPCFAYRFPYQIGGEYRYIRNEHLALSPVISDTSGSMQNPMTPNHGGAIVQVLCQDGSVRTFTTYKLPGFDDDVYHNDLGIVAAGLGKHDVVLGPSNASPGLGIVSQGK